MYLLWPFGFDFDLYVKNWKEHDLVGQRWVDKIQETIGTYALVYANLAFTLELTGGGSSGLDFPQDRIFDVVNETFFGYREFALYIGDHYNYD